jgi:aspartyl-tRNA(Asn)/glutamyl-tRNA(Gln) amidotransferase subunit B
VIANFKKLTAVVEIDADALQALVNQVLTAHPNEVQRYQNGETKLLGYFMGQLLRLSKKKLSPTTVDKVLRQSLIK